MRNLECEFCDRQLRGNVPCHCDESRRQASREAAHYDEGHAAYHAGAVRNGGAHFAWIEGFDDARAQAERDSQDRERRTQDAAPEAWGDFDGLDRRLDRLRSGW